MQDSLKQQAERYGEDRNDSCICAAEILQEMEHAVSNTAQSDFKACRLYYGKRLSRLEQLVKQAQKKAGNLLTFLKDAFGEGSELGLAVGDLTATPEAAAFIGQFLSLEFFEASRSLQLKNREDSLLKQIELTL